MRETTSKVPEGDRSTIKAVSPISCDRVGKGRLATYLRLSTNRPFPVIVSLTYMVFRIFTSTLLTKHVRRLIRIQLI